MPSRTLRFVGIVVLIATLGAVSCQAFLSADDHGGETSVDGVDG